MPDPSRLRVNMNVRPPKEEEGSLEAPSCGGQAG
jgi:hypothetical protein